MQGLSIEQQRTLGHRQSTAAAAQCRNTPVFVVEALYNRAIKKALAQTRAIEDAACPPALRVGQDFDRPRSVPTVERVHHPVIAEQTDQDRVRLIHVTLRPHEQRIRFGPFAKVGQLKRLIDDIFAVLGKARPAAARPFHQRIKEFRSLWEVTRIVAAVAFGQRLIRVEIARLNPRKGGGISCLRHSDLNCAGNRASQDDRAQAKLDRGIISRQPLGQIGLLWLRHGIADVAQPRFSLQA